MPNIELIKSNVESWVAALTDGTRRNRLLFLDRKPDSSSILELGSIHNDLFNKLLKGHQINVTTLQPESEAQRSRMEKTMASIIRKAYENEEERGLQTLYTGAVMVEFDAKRGEGRNYCAPLFLLPMNYAREKGERRKYVVRYEGSVMLNETLFITLKKERSLNLDSLTEQFEQRIQQGTLLEAMESIKDAFRRQCSSLSGLRISDDILLSNFSYQKMKMVVELTENQETLIPKHNVITALCGDPEVRSKVQPDQPLFKPEDIDSIPPEDDFTFLPADSSQFVTIRQVINGWNGVIQGPPGTGKSQTIANLIGELVARKKKVLFVAQKSAALEVVQTRLKQAGLGDIVLNLHGGEMKAAELKIRIEKAQNLLTEEAPEVEPIHRSWVKQMVELGKHRTLFHAPLDKWHVNTYQCYEELLAFKGKEMERYHIGMEALQAIQPDDLEFAIEQLCDHHAMQAKVPSDSPWRKLLNWNEYTLNDFELASRNYTTTYQSFRQLSERVYNELQWALPETLHELQQDSQVISRFVALYPRVTALVWKEDLSEAIKQLRKTALSKGKHQVLALLSPSYKKAIKKLRTYTSAEPLPRQEALSLLEEIQQLRELRTTNNLTPEYGNNETYSILHQHLLAIEGLKPFLDISDQRTSLIHLESDIRALRKTQSTGIDMHNLAEIREKLKALGLLEWADVTLGVDIQKIPALFRYNFYSDLLDKHKIRAPKIPFFAGKDFEKHRNKFVELDIRKQQVAVKRILTSYAESLKLSENKFPAEYDYLKWQMAKKRPVSFRKILDRAENMMLSTFPVWMTSPLSVTLLTEAKTLFDVVLFDEASQVKPEDAICAILRGKQIVVAGDTRQLPPTPFFENESYDNFSEDSENEEATEPEVTTVGFESLMDMVIGNLPGLGKNNDGWFLEWHYRSKDEALIAFSNSHIYENRMITFPGPKAQFGVGFIQADARKMGNRTDPAIYEAQRVVDEVFRIARSNPEASIGVIAFGLKQTNLIETEFEKALQTQHDEVKNYFSQTGREAFFIKNLESVQGDERDFIVLSIGKQRNENGVIPLNFGPITQRGGERRLNVAITRARHGMTVVASFDPEEIEPIRTKNNKGNDLLRRYMLFAKNHGKHPNAEMVQNETNNQFERDIRQRLEKKGLKISSNYGASRYRLDLVVHHPQHDDRFVMAIECDGSAFNGIPCIRDRDRLREEHLKKMGWKIVHVWYADWYSNPEAEVERIFDLYSKYLNEPEPQPQPVVVKEVEPIAQTSPIVNTRVPAVLNFPQKENIKEYTDEELIKLIKWVQSDGVRRNHKEIFEEAFKELPFTNRGSVIKQRVLKVIREVYP